jgi:hypothetical protein
MMSRRAPATESALPLLVVLLFATGGCRSVAQVRQPSATSPPAVFRGAQTNSGTETYSSWFGDTDGHIFYFGLSAFWNALQQCEAQGGERSLCSLSDLLLPGDHLIGRFDMDHERFLDPLVVRRADPRAPSSVWDVLVHSNGRIYYTTMWDEFGSVRPDGTDVRHYTNTGSGLNELWEGPDGEIYATRYLGNYSGARDENGAVVVFGPDGERRREFPFKIEDGVSLCPRNIAVNPRTRDIWVNTDMFDPDGSARGHDTFRLSTNGRVIERIVTPWVAFPSFDAAGRGWFIDDADGRWTLRIVEVDGRTTYLDLGAHGEIDVPQDMKHAGNLTVISTWERNVFVVRALGDGQYELATLPVMRLTDCPRDFQLGYTAVVSHSGVVYETVACGITVIRAGDVGAGVFSEPER